MPRPAVPCVLSCPFSRRACRDTDGALVIYEGRQAAVEGAEAMRPGRWREWWDVRAWEVADSA